jgi:pSer/pThr/pTyr-binding forkhead associated (FHA) protein
MPIFITIDTEGVELLELQLHGKVSFGRSSRCDLQIDDPKLSGSHGFFDFNEHGNLVYTDLNSTNGSFVNNNKVTSTIFKIGDVLKVGKTTITIDESRLNLKETKALGRRARDTQTDLKVPTMQTNLKKISIGEDSQIIKKHKQKKGDLSLVDLSQSLSIEKDKKSKK